MKTVSSGKDRNGAEIKYRPVGGQASHNSSTEALADQTLNESDNLIICHSQLASSFQEVKISKTRLKPGHYLQKVFLHKLKSQSAPSLDKGKNNNNPNDNNEAEKESSCFKLLTEVPTDNGSEELIDKEANESRYKTWPDCIDKSHNNIVVDEEVPKARRTSEQDNNIHSGNLEFPVVNKGPRKFVCDNLNGVKRNGAIPIDNLLESLPIAYSPITKQIHIITCGNGCDSKCLHMCGADKPDVSVKCSDSDHMLHMCKELSSISSTVSSLSDVSPSTNGDAGSVSGTLFDNGDNCSLLSIGNCSIISQDSTSSKPKRKSLSSFFTRGVFAWKTRSDSGEGWSLFGRGEGCSEGSKSRPGSALSEDRRSLTCDSVLGSTGLIQLERPAWLPAKPKLEQRAHTDEHDRILQANRKKELKEAKQRKKLLQSQLKVEDELSNATKVWLLEILPKWPQMRSEKKTLDLWWEGVPPCVRGRVWQLAIGNHLNITHDLYQICAQRAQERLRSGEGLDEETSIGSDRERSMQLIQLDINRTFPNLCIFQKKGPYYEMLHWMLGAYVCYRPDVGYVQGMSFIAAVLILNMEPPDAFISFANLLNRPCHRAFYTLDQDLMEGYFATYEELLKENLPKLSEHFEICKLTPDLYLLDWVYTVFAKAMNIDLASRLWDVFLRDGDEFIFRAAIGVLKLCQDTLMSLDFVSGSQYLTKLPELCPNRLFASIASIRMSSRRLSFSDILQAYTHTSSGSYSSDLPKRI